MLSCYAYCCAFRRYVDFKSGARGRQSFDRFNWKLKSRESLCSPAVCSLKIGFRMNKVFQRREAGWQAVCYGNKEIRIRKFLKKNWFLLTKELEDWLKLLQWTSVWHDMMRKDVLTGLKYWWVIEVMTGRGIILSADSNTTSLQRQKKNKKEPAAFKRREELLPTCLKPSLKNVKLQKNNL